MTAREIRRILEKHSTISKRMDEVLAEIRDIDGYNQGTDISQPKASNRGFSSSVELAAEKRIKLSKELQQLFEKERESYWEISNLLIYVKSGKPSYMNRGCDHNKLLRDYYLGNLEEAELIEKYGKDYQKQITAGIAKLVKVIA